MGPVAKPLLWILQTLHSKVPNWGWCIVLMTLVINFAMFPLKMKSWRSMQKMQKVAPEIRQIQDRYKKYSMSDPRKKKMNEEVMAVYGREGINPMGRLPADAVPDADLVGAVAGAERGDRVAACAMDGMDSRPFGEGPVLYSADRHDHHDVADDENDAADYGGPGAAENDGADAVVHGVSFFLSSGLNLYMFTSNLVGVGQQYYLNRTKPLPVPKPKFKKKKE